MRCDIQPIELPFEFESLHLNVKPDGFVLKHEWQLLVNALDVLGTPTWNFS